MTLGPLELVVIGCEGARVPKVIGVELAAFERTQAIRLLDIAFVTKRVDGRISCRRVRDLDERERRAFAGAFNDVTDPLLRQERISGVAESLRPGTTAVLALFEHTWKTGLRDALRHSDAYLITDELLPQETVAALDAQLEEITVLSE